MIDPQPRGSHGKPHRTTKILSCARRRNGRLPLAVLAQQGKRNNSLRRSGRTPQLKRDLCPEGRMAYQEIFVRRDQHRIYVRDHPGAEPAIILMHGFPDNVHLYDRLFPYLSPPRRVVLFDFLKPSDH